MTKKVFSGESWYEGEKASVCQHTGTLSKVTDDRPGFGRNYQYVLILGDGEPLPVYSGGDIQILNDFVGQEVKICGKSVCCQVNGHKEAEIWPGEIEVVRDGVVPGPEM